MIFPPIVKILYKTIVYVMYFLGLWLLFRPAFHFKFIVYRLLNNKWSVRDARPNATRRNVLSVFKPIDLLLQATWKWYNPHSLERFVALSLAFFVVSMPLSFRLVHSFFYSLAVALLFASLPFVPLILLLHRNRSVASHKLTDAISLLLANYRSNNKDLYFAMMRTIGDIDNKIIKRAFLKLAPKIQYHNSDSDMENAVRLFVYKIQTSWAKQLGVLILNAAIDGRDIENGLQNIALDMKEGQKVLEQEKSNNYDTVLLGYLPLVAFPLTLVFMKVISGKFNILHYQFFTHSGITSFAITGIVCLLGCVLTSFLRLPKNDL